MVDATTVRRKIEEKFPGIQDIGDGILRGERRYQGKTYAMAYIDLSDHVVERAADLSTFQERLLGRDFFKADGDQRWNSYLYFWAGPHSQENEAFPKAKARIEGDRHFARKFVLSEADLLDRFEEVPAQATAAHVSDDVSGRWEELLKAASLSIVLEQRPRTQLMELIGSGQAFIDESIVPTKPFPTLDMDPLSTGLLRHLQIGSFRPAISGREFSFGDVNLIFGQNGAGKTSLLEAIEALYCGRIRRDPAAVVGSIKGKVITPEGVMAEVQSPTTAAVAKARNLAWYGRSNQQSSAISQTFTRFNFLDTDAAFRLSNETKPEQIKEDLSLLLVGAEASTLWTYINKTWNDTISKGNSARERIPLLLKQTELLGSDVRRLRETPTESTTLAKSYRAALHDLGARWSLGEEATPVVQSDRAHLEFLSRGFRQAITVAQSTPTTTALLHARQQSLRQNLESLNSLTQEYDAVQTKLTSSETEAWQLQASLNVLQNWLVYCQAGIPVLVVSLNNARAQVDALVTTTGGVSAEQIRDLPLEFSIRPINDAIEAATADLRLAEQQERSGVEMLQQREQLGESLVALRRDLSDVARTILDKTGDSLHCPVCMTIHSNGELLQKIDALSVSEDPSATEGLRQAIQTSRERGQRARSALSSLKTLQRYAIASQSPDVTPANDLLKQLQAKDVALAALVEELDQLKSNANSLGLSATQWKSYKEVQEAAIRVLGESQDHASVDVVNAHIALLREELESQDEAQTQLQELLSDLSDRAIELMKTAGVSLLPSSSLDEFGTAVERALSAVENCLVFTDEASQLIHLQEDQPFEALQLSIDDAIGVFDRALHAERTEASTHSDLTNKINDLQDATKQLEDSTENRDNFEKASKVLSTIVQDHSLEDATQEALDSIREHVGNIFARIHSPAEYTLGNFESDALLTTRDGQQLRGVHQVSTGQRAALALSIFLSLNRSAESAPPVMLIDDPVAHIDDLNALSFLDYLRDLAVSGRKQIFFATADAKLAALFQRKFEFLGENRFKKIVLSR